MQLLAIQRCSKPRRVQAQLQGKAESNPRVLSEEPGLLSKENQEFYSKGVKAQLQENSRRVKAPLQRKLRSNRVPFLGSLRSDRVSLQRKTEPLFKEGPGPTPRSDKAILQEKPRGRQSPPPGKGRAPSRGRQSPLQGKTEPLSRGNSGEPKPLSRGKTGEPRPLSRGKTGEPKSLSRENLRVLLQKKLKSDRTLLQGRLGVLLQRKLKRGRASLQEKIESISRRGRTHPQGELNPMPDSHDRKNSLQRKKIGRCNLIPPHFCRDNGVHLTAFQNPSRASQVGYSGMALD